MANNQNYDPPKLCIFQDFQAVLSAGAAPLYPVIVGPAYALHRYEEEAEKESIATYDRTQQTGYLWPGHIAGGVIDLVNAKIINEDALLNYYTSPTPSNLVEDNSNRLKFDDIIATNDEGLRDASLGDRDVTAGDVVRISVSGTQVLETVVIATEADVIEGTTDPDSERVTGSGSTVEGATQNSASPTAYTLAYDATAYEGLIAGYPSDDYSIQVTVVGTGGAGALDGTTLKITAASGDSNTVTLGTSNYVGPQYTVPLGTRGASLDVTDAGSGSVAIADTWSVTVAQTYAEIDVTDDAQFKPEGPYSGAQNSQYVLTVLQGGVLGTNDVKIQFQTTNGQDTTGIIQATAASFTGSSVVHPFGNRNMSLTLFDTLEMRTGDVITFDVEASKEGEIHTIVMRDALAELAATDLDVQLFAKTTFEVSTLFYDLAQGLISIYANMTHTSDILGSPATYDIYDGTLYADYREQRTIGTGSIGSLDSATAIQDALGTVDALNPIACGVNEAFRLSNGVSVYYIAITTDDDAGYLEALETLTRDELIYGLVPLSNSETVKRAYAQHVSERSQNCNNQWRGLWLANDELPVTGVYGHESDLSATVEDLPPGGARKVVSVGALFATNGAQAGDILRINYDLTDPLNPTYEEYIIDSADEDFVTLLNPLTAPITVAMKIEIWRNLSDYEYACAIGEYSSSYNSRRIKAVWADGYVTEDGEDKNLTYLCAYLAGARAGAAPHASLSNVEHPGVLLDERYLLSAPNMNIAAAGGTWLVVKNTSDVVYTRHQLTTVADASNLNEREDSITSNLDHISREFKEETQDLIGKGNVSPQMVALISARVNNVALEISSRPYSDILGPQLIDVENVSVKINQTLQDTIDVVMDPLLPKPLNNLNISFRVS
jgi:hypothetical protein